MMNENVLDVLMYLLDNYMGNDSEIFQNHADITSVLEEAGFEREQIHQAFDWLKNVVKENPEAHFCNLANSKGLRAYMHYEIEKLGRECCGFLIFLEQIGLLDPPSREIIIDHAMALDADEIDLDRLKWIIMMVISEKTQQHPFHWLQDLQWLDKDYLH